MTDTIGTNFTAATEPFRRELVVHCYQMLGSVHEAEDLAQETLLRAWRARDSYDEHRASLRTWLYRILEVPWLQPLPDRYLSHDQGDPLARATERDGVRLAMVAAVQLLPARQRAALVLRDVLRFSAGEVAAQLGTSVAAVNSALQRARATLAEAAPDRDEVRAPDDRTVRETVERYIRAFEAADVDTLVTLLTVDAVLEMPPVPLWYVGREHYGRFIARVFAMRGTGWRMVRTSANGQPALAAYCPDGAGPPRLHTLQVLSVSDRGIAHNVVFQAPEVFAAFQLAPALPDHREPDQ